MPSQPPQEAQGGGRIPLPVLLLLSSLHGGGAERVAVHLLNRLDPARFDVRMGLLHASGPYLKDVDPKRVLAAPAGELRFAFAGGSVLRPSTLLRGAVAAPRAFAAMIERARPDVVLSFLKGTNLMVWRALAIGAGPRPRWIAREGNNALAVIRDETPGALAAWAVAALTARAYRTADRVLTISAAQAEDVARDFGLDRARVATIPNPVDLAGVRAAAALRPANPPARPFVLTAGRLEHQKGHDLLLRAFATSGAAATHELVILGQGSRRAELGALAHRLGLVDVVGFPGFVADPFAWMGACALFVLPSRWEGFGSVVAEAMAAGAPVLATACDYGPREIVEHGTSGWLVPPDDESALGTAMARLLADAGLRARLAAGGCARAERFALEPIVARYAALFEEVAASDPAGTQRHAER